MSQLRMDNRGLSPPEPLMRILAALDPLESGNQIVAEMDRQPLFLYPELEERGCTYTCELQPEGHYLLTIDKP